MALTDAWMLVGVSDVDQDMAIVVVLEEKQLQ
jgi:hypothetical protein